MNDLKRKYLDFIARCKRRGEPLAAYRCPACDYLTYTPQPAQGEVYDSMTTCPNCGLGYFKIVQDDGAVTLSPCGRDAA